MDLTKNLIIANGEVITPGILSIDYKQKSHKINIRFKNLKSYSYLKKNIIWLKNPTKLNPANYQISSNGKKIYNIRSIYCFKDHQYEYWYICCKNGFQLSCNRSQLIIEQSTISDPYSKNVFEYLKETSKNSELKGEDGAVLLKKQFEKIDFIGSDTALGAYISPGLCVNKKYHSSIPIFPFGCNKSQYKAVKNALENQISVIEGPPGTGKTLTILNILSNLITKGMTVQVVSNNNSATENIFDKLSSEKYQLDFIVAVLGKSQKKKAFIMNQDGVYPEILKNWDPASSTKKPGTSEIQSLSEDTYHSYELLTKRSELKTELNNLKVEFEHFKHYSRETHRLREPLMLRKKLILKDIFFLWDKGQKLAEKKNKVPFLYKIKCRFFYGIGYWSFYKEGWNEILGGLQRIIYDQKQRELENEIETTEKKITELDYKGISKNLTDLSLIFFRQFLFKKYGKKKNRPYFKYDDLWKNPKSIQNEYPIILSTSFSARSSLGKDAKFDYVIIDEASQVDITTGALALSCARNAVVVGDSKQLPNVITETNKVLLQDVFYKYEIPEGYNFVKNSFLSSINTVIPEVPNTLLREHYRCNPRIINFCNQKFYNNQLLIMTKEPPGEDSISLIKTVKGNHQRGKTNRRQADVLLKEVLPTISDTKGVGVIVPYRDQVNLLNTLIKEDGIEINTIHKFQGREKETIILSTVDDEYNVFSDDPHLLNVALSRAKNKLILITTGNEMKKNSHLRDLMEYIEYNHYTIKESKIYSVFDYLYKQYSSHRLKILKEFNKISEYDSENLMNILLTKTLQKEEYSSLDYISHQPLNMLIKYPYLLNDEETKYAMNSATHLDFLIYNQFSKQPVLAIEVDGFIFHKKGSRQAKRDEMKNHILELYEIPLIRYNTTESEEKTRLINKLNEVLEN